MRDRLAAGVAARLPDGAVRINGDPAGKLVTWGFGADVEEDVTKVAETMLDQGHDGGGFGGIF